MSQLNELKIPYLGIKIESLPTILRVLNISKDENDFYFYFKELGKADRTIYEYLASLRNLKLANKDDTGQTKITSMGLYLIKDDIGLFYKNLLKHCMKYFPDLKIVRDVIRKNDPSSLNQLLIYLKNDGYTINRKQTLSSFFKLINESEYINDKKPVINGNELVEFNQFYRYILSFSKYCKSDTISIIDFINYLKNENLNENNIPDLTLKKYLKMLDSEGRIRLHFVNRAIVEEPSAYLNIDDKYYYKFEVMRNEL